ncbi:helix-turn-helix transcriptional regulator [Donghicola sp. XS_ASV15]|uniref:helix-turn-helix transcriptional regulator n=1 Tax=Donghicola sp. XS_ASV15 TaxID=3241295 RepID=UPI0035176702
METRKIIKIRAVCERTQLSRATIYRKQVKGEFPSSVKLSTRCVGWYADEIEMWLGQLPRTHSG